VLYWATLLKGVHMHLVHACKSALLGYIPMALAVLFGQHLVDCLVPCCALGRIGRVYVASGVLTDHVLPLLALASTCAAIGVLVRLSATGLGF
jgi:hypothetical protein